MHLLNVRNFGNSIELSKRNVQVVAGVCKAECKKMVQDFFVEKRDQTL